MTRRAHPRRLHGIGAGLVSRDLNIRAQVALTGLSDTPVPDITALLRSDKPIDAKTRAKLADCFEGRGHGLRIKVEQNRRTKEIRELLRKIIHVREGRFAKERAEQVGYTRAVAELSELVSKSPKSAEASVTLANQVDGWIERYRVNDDHAVDRSDLELEITFLLSKIDRRDPATVPLDEVKAFAAVAAGFLARQNAALEKDEWFLG